MTHGHILIEDDRDPPVHMYTWHDGHFREAVHMLYSMPHCLVRSAVESYRFYESLRKPDGEFRELSDEDVTANAANGPWFFRTLMTTNHKMMTYERVVSSFRSMNPIELYKYHMASWISWYHFNTWVSLPLEDIVYPGVDVMVKIVDHDNYTITAPVKNNSDEEEFDDETKEAIAKLNKDMPEKAKIGIEEREKAYPILHVPFTNILIERSWQAIKVAKPSKRKRK